MPALLPEFDTVETDSSTLPDFGDSSLPDFGEPSPDLSQVKLSPYQTLDRNGLKPPSGMESGTEFLTAVGSSPVGRAAIAGGEAIGGQIQDTAKWIGDAYLRSVQGDSMGAIETLTQPVARAAGYQLGEAGKALWRPVGELAGESDWDELSKQYPKLMAIPKVVKGVVESVPKMAAQALLGPEIGPAVWGLTDEGFDAKTAATMYALPWVKNYTGAIAETVASKMGINNELAKQVVNRVAGGTAMAGVLTGEQIDELRKLSPEERAKRAPETIGNALAMFAMGTLERGRIPEKTAKALPVTGEALKMPDDSAVPPKVPFELPDAARSPEPIVVPPEAQVAAQPIKVGDRLPKTERDAEGFADADNQPEVQAAIDSLPVGTRLVDFLVGSVYEKQGDGSWKHRPDVQEPGNSSEQQRDGSAILFGRARILRLGTGDQVVVPPRAEAPGEQIYFHGTRSKNDFDVPNIPSMGESSSAFNQYGAFFSQSLEYAKSQARGEGVSRVKAFRLQFNNPAYLPTEEIALMTKAKVDALKVQGYDAVISTSKEEPDVVVFTREQIIPVDSVPETLASVPVVPPTPPPAMTVEEHTARYPVIKSDALVDGREQLNPERVPNMSSIGSSIDNPKVLHGIREVPMSHFPGINGRHYSVEGQKKIDALVEEIKASGQISPLIVVIDSDGPYVLEGSTRIDALFKLGAKSFPAKVVLDIGDIEKPKAPVVPPRAEAPAVAPAEKPAAPVPPTGDRLVTVERPDGTRYLAAFGDKFWPGEIPSVAKLTSDGKWSHGMTGKGEKIIEDGGKGALEPPKPAAAPPPTAAPAPPTSSVGLSAPVDTSVPIKPKRAYSGAKYQADATEFERLVQEYGMNHEHGWIKNPDFVAPKEGTWKDISSNTELTAAYLRVLEQLGLKTDRATLRAKAEALPKLKALLEKHAKMVPVPLTQMQEGSEFTRLGENHKVAGTNQKTGMVTIKDGIPIKVHMDDSVKIDPGSLKTPEATTPKLRPGEKGTADLLQGPDAPFNLAGEVTGDAARIAAETKAKADSAAAAKELADKQQQDLFKPAEPTKFEVGDELTLTGPGGVEQVSYRGPLEDDMAVVATRRGSQISVKRSQLSKPAAPEKGMPPSQDLGAAVPSAFEGRGDFVSDMFAAIDKDRAERGVPPLEGSLSRTWKSDGDKALAIMRKDPSWIPTLIDRVTKDPRPLLTFEKAGTVYYRANLKAELNNAYRRINRAVKDNNLEGVDADQILATELEAKIDALDHAVGRGGTGSEAGASLNAQKMAADDDFNLVSMVMEKKARLKRELTPGEMSDLQTKADAYQKASEALQKDLTASETRNAELNAKLALEQIEKENLRNKIPDFSPKVLEVARKWVDKWDKEATESMHNLLGKSWSPSPEMLLDLAKVARGNIAHVGLGFTEWSVKMSAQLGKGVEKFLKAAWDAGQKMIDNEIGIPEPARKAIRKNATDAEKQADITERIKTKLEGKRLDEITPLVKKLARQFSDQGVRGWRALTDAVHGVLKELIPDLDYRDTMDAISGHGKFRLPDQAEGAKAVKDAVDQIQIIRKIQEVIAHEPVKPSGFKRDPRSAVARRLNQIFENSKRLFGVVVTDPATQLRSALQARKTYYEHRISDLQAEINSRKRVVKTKAQQPTDAALEKLVSEYQTVKAAHDEVFGQRELSDAQRAELEAKSIDRQIIEVQRQLKEGDIFPDTKGTGFKSPANEAKLANLEALKAERENLRESIQPKIVPELQELERINKRREQLEAAILEAERKINTGDIGTSVRTAKPELTAELEAMKGERNQLNAMVSKLRAAAKPELSDAQRLIALKANLLRRTADASRKLAAGDFSKAPRRPLPQLDSEALRLRFNLNTVQRQIMEGRAADARKMQSGAKKALRYTGEVINTMRALKTSFDLSAVLRQGGFIAFGHPIRALKSFPAMLKAFYSEKGQFNAAEEIRNRPNAPLYDQAKLYLAEHGGRLSQMEEAYMSRWSDKIPGVRSSGRAYTTFLNKLRADSFDSMAATLSRNGTLSLPQAKIVANFINVATGRSSVALDQAAVALNTAFFAPRYVASRFQLLSGQPLWGGGPIKGQAQVRSLIAFEYARFLAGAAVVYTLGIAAGATVETDSRSSDFGKIKIGNTRIDPMAGLIQSTVLASRLTTGETKSAKGQIVPIRGDKVPFGRGDASDVVWRFIRSKLSPAVGETINIVSGKDVVGNKVLLTNPNPDKLSQQGIEWYATKSIPSRFFGPIGVVDIYQAMQSEGIPNGTALGVLSIFGMGLQTYTPKGSSPTSTAPPPWESFR